MLTLPYSTLACAGLISYATQGQELQPCADLPGAAVQRLTGLITADHPLHQLLNQPIPATFDQIPAEQFQLADATVARALATLPPREALSAALNSEQQLTGLLSYQQWQQRQTLTHPALQAVFDWRFSSVLRYVVHLTTSNTWSTANPLTEIQQIVATFNAALVPYRKALFAGAAANQHPVLGFPVAGPDQAPSTLFSPTAGVVDFLDRAGLAEKILSWVRSDKDFDVQIVAGAHGSGKTRLAVEVCRALAPAPGQPDGWLAGFFDGTDLPALLSALAATAQPRLVVLDHAEYLHHVAAHFLETLRQSANYLAPVRVLFLVETLSTSLADDVLATLAPWQTSVAQHYPEITQAPVTVLSSDLLDLEQRQTLFAQSVTGFTQRLGAPAPADLDDFSFLTEYNYGDPLAILIAAYLHLHGIDPAPLDRNQQTAPLLAQEALYWEQQAARPDLGLELTSAQQRTAIAVACLTQHVSFDQARTILRALPGIGDDAVLERTITWLTQLYPNPVEQPWGLLKPTRLVNQLIADELTDQPELIASILRAAMAAGCLLYPLQELASVSAYHDDLAHTVATVLNAELVDWTAMAVDPQQNDSEATIVSSVDSLSSLITVIGHHCDPEVLRQVYKVSQQRDELLQLRYAAVAAVVRHHPTTDDKQRVADLDALSIVLARTGDVAEAHELCQDVIKRYRALAAEEPTPYQGKLATALSIHSNILCDLNHTEQAYEASQEALDILRRQAAEGQEVEQDQLALVLSNHANRLEDLERFDEALAHSAEALEIAQELASQNPDKYRSKLHGALSNRMRILSRLNKIEEACAIGRELVAANPTTYLPGIAQFFTGAAVMLQQASRHEEALGLAQESAEMYRQLAADQPAYQEPLTKTLQLTAALLLHANRYDQALATEHEALTHCRELAARDGDYAEYLAWMLANHANRLRKLNRAAEAVPLLAESVAGYRTLAATDPSHITNLADVLYDQIALLTHLGRSEEAFNAVCEAIPLYRQLAANDPARYTVDLAKFLSQQGDYFYAVDRFQEALSTSEETVALYQQLAAENPDAYTYDLALSLGNHANHYYSLNQLDHALAASQRAIYLYQQLAEKSPGSFEDALALAVNNHSIMLSTQGRYPEALQVSHQALGLYRQLSQTAPTQYRPRIIKILSNQASWLSSLGYHQEAQAAQIEAARLAGHPS